MSMNVKICGLREPDNIEAILPLAPDYLGFIFYERSARYAGRHLDPWFARELRGPKKVGVFVNEKQAEVERTVERYGLDLVQLHGEESPALCEQLRTSGLGVIKVFSVGEAFDFAALAAYEPYVDYFLFDTKGKLPGGNGYVFNWQVMATYPSAVPFFLSGGIGPDHQEAVRQLDFPQLHALDINSQFEVKPGRKDVEKLRTFLSSLARS
jgi:phosphoribosylanthranilate isomerase